MVRRAGIQIILGFFVGYCSRTVPVLLSHLLCTLPKHVLSQAQISLYSPSGKIVPWFGLFGNLTGLYEPCFISGTHILESHIHALRRTIASPSFTLFPNPSTEKRASHSASELTSDFIHRKPRNNLFTLRTLHTACPQPQLGDINPRISFDLNLDYHHLNRSIWYCTNAQDVQRTAVYRIRLTYFFIY